MRFLKDNRRFLLILLAAALIKIFKTALYGYLSVYIFPLIFLFFGVVIVYSYFYLLALMRQKKFKHLLLCLLCASALLLPLDDWYERARFEVLKEQMAQTAELLMDKYPNQNSSIYNLALPKEKRYLSRGGGEVNLVAGKDTLGVAFYTYRGLAIGHSEEYIYYRHNGLKCDYFNNCQSATTINDNWQYCVFTDS